MNLYGKAVTVEAHGNQQTHTEDLYGYAGLDGSCSGALVRIEGKLYKNLILTTKVKTNIETTTAHYIPTLRQLVISNEIRLPISNKTGYHEDKYFGTYVYNKDEVPTTRCQLYKSLLTANATLHQPREPDLQTFISLTVNSSQVAILGLMEKESICGREAFKTSEQNLFLVFHRERDEEIEEFKQISDQDVDPALDEKTQLRTIIYDLSLRTHNDFETTLAKICESRRDNLQSHLAQPILNANKGYEILPYGSANYVVEGNKLKASISREEVGKCCIELPIYVYVNETKKIPAYADPRTMVIRSLCTPRICDQVWSYYYALDFEGRNETTWVCTKGTPELHLCSEIPQEVKAMSTPEITMTETLKKTNVKPSIYPDEQLKSHRLAKLVSETRGLIEYRTAIDMASHGKIEGVRFLTSDPGQKEIETIKSKILGPIDTLLHGQWTGFVSGLVTLLSTILMILIIYKVIVVILKKISHTNPTTKIGGINLGSRRQYKVLKKENENKYEALKEMMNGTENRAVAQLANGETRDLRLGRLEGQMSAITKFATARNIIAHEALIHGE